MKRRFQDIPIDQIMTEHYLFDLDQSVERTAEILDEDEGDVRKIHDDYIRLTTMTRRDK